MRKHFYLAVRLQDVVHSEKRLYLVFEYLDFDLKQHMDSTPGFSKDSHRIKAGFFSTHLGFMILS